MTTCRSTLSALCAAALIMYVPATAAAQTQPTPSELQKLLDSLRPTTEHKDLAQLEGRWKIEGTFLMGGPPMKTTGTVTNRMILDGRFLVSEGTSNNPSGFGDPTIGLMTIYGFDRRTSDFTIVAFDTMGTYYVTAAGKKDANRRIVMAGVIFKFPGQPDQTIMSLTHRRVR